MDRELEKIIGKINLLPEDEKQQDRRDLREFQEKTEKMNSHAKETIESLRAAAKKLDDVWKDCKISHAVGTSVGILGGLLTIGGGIATALTAGAATPLLIAGLCVGGAGATTNLGTAIVERLINSAEIKEAEKHLGETIDSVNEVNRIVQEVLMTKERARLIYIYYLANTLKLGNPMVLKILRELVFLSVGTPTKMVIQLTEKVIACAQAASQASVKAATQAADDVAQEGARAGSDAVGETVGKVIIVANAAFVLSDAIDLVFTIRDLVENKGSEAAKVLRQKADKLENAMKE